MEKKSSMKIEHAQSKETREQAFKGIDIVIPPKGRT
jgi:hypothetical protein